MVLAVLRSSTRPGRGEHLATDRNPHQHRLEMAAAMVSARSFSAPRRLAEAVAGGAPAGCAAGQQRVTAVVYQSARRRPASRTFVSWRAGCPAAGASTAGTWVKP